MDVPPGYTRQRASSTTPGGPESAGPFSQSGYAPPPSSGGESGGPTPSLSNMHAQLGSMVWEASSRQIKESFNSYGRIDLFRPYFDVEPIQVRNRLIQSFLPRKPSQISVSTDLYGPTMIVLTMIALLLWNMKSSGFIVQSGTLMGTAFVSSFAGWFFLSGCLYTLCFLLSTDVSLVHVFSLFGYSMTSHCVVLFLTSLYHPLHDHVYFFALLLLFCLPAAMRMAFYLSARTREKTYKATLMACVIAVHLLYITYLHFGFHVIAEEIDEILGDAPAGNVAYPKLPTPIALPVGGALNASV